MTQLPFITVNTKLSDCFFLEEPAQDCVLVCASAHAYVHSCVRACMFVLGVEWKGRLFGNNESAGR